MIYTFSGELAPNAAQFYQYGPLERSYTIERCVVHFPSGSDFELQVYPVYASTSATGGSTTDLRPYGATYLLRGDSYLCGDDVRLPVQVRHLAPSGVWIGYLAVNTSATEVHAFSAIMELV